MSKVVVIQEAIGKCQICGTLASVRPYGPKGKQICYDCGEKPENRECVKNAIAALIDSANQIIWKNRDGSTDGLYLTKHPDGFKASLREGT